MNRVGQRGTIGLHAKTVCCGPLKTEKGEHATEVVCPCALRPIDLLGLDAELAGLVGHTTNLEPEIAMGKRRLFRQALEEVLTQMTGIRAASCEQQPMRARVG